MSASVLPFTVVRGRRARRSPHNESPAQRTIVTWRLRGDGVEVTANDASGRVLLTVYVPAAEDESHDDEVRAVISWVGSTVASWSRPRRVRCDRKRVTHFVKTEDVFRTIVNGHKGVVSDGISAFRVARRV